MLTPKVFTPAEVPIPKDREIYILTDSGDVIQVSYDDTAALYTRKDQWSGTDGESGVWSCDEIINWSDDQAYINAAAAVYLEQV